MQDLALETLVSSQSSGNLQWSSVHHGNRHDNGNDGNGNAGNAGHWHMTMAMAYSSHVGPAHRKLPKGTLVALEGVFERSVLAIAR